MAAKPVGIKISNRTYGRLSDQPLFVTPELRDQLEKTKRRDRSNAYDFLLARGFRGGKHLIEIVREELGGDVAIVLSHDRSALTKKRVTIDYPRYLEIGENRFFDVYRQTGITTAVAYLNENFPKKFTTKATDLLPPTKDVRNVFDNLSEAADELPKKDRARLPEKIADLIERQGPTFVLGLLQSVDAAIPKGQERLAATFKEVIGRLAQEGATALSELSDLMSQWSLYQVTSLMHVLRHRLATIDMFATLIEDDGTYELKTDKSVHRTLEKSMWLLKDDYWIAQSNKTLRTVIGKELARGDKQYEKKRPDFACVNASGKIVLVEIKRPSVELRKYEIDQAESYLRIVRKNTGDRKKPDIYLIGRQISQEAHELAELRGYPELLTYQEMISSTRQRYQEYLDIVEKQQ